MKRKINVKFVGNLVKIYIVHKNAQEFQLVKQEKNKVSHARIELATYVRKTYGLTTCLMGHFVFRMEFESIISKLKVLRRNQFAQRNIYKQKKEGNFRIPLLISYENNYLHSFSRDTFSELLAFLYVKIILHLLLFYCLISCGEVDSNHRPQGYEPCELPLLHPAIYCK